MTRKDRLATRAVFAARIWSNGFWAAIIVAGALGVGVIGYMYFGTMGVAQAFANASMILSGMGPLDQMETTAGFIFEGVYALVCGLLFFAVAGLILAPMFHRLLHRFHLEDTAEAPPPKT
jgi:sterol desaturase/sphingolipid hydroxylase (fatty acid hydroxylase superfamily)